MLCWQALDAEEAGEVPLRSKVGWEEKTGKQWGEGIGPDFYLRGTYQIEYLPVLEQKKKPASGKSTFQ